MSIVLNSLISEKANRELEIHKRYIFFVNPKANKIQISNEINKLFGVEVVKVRTMIYAPNIKIKNTKRGLQVGKSSKLKKAIIELNQGQQIDIYSSDDKI